MQDAKVDLAAEAANSRALVEHRFDVLDGHVCGAPQIRDHAGIDVTGPSAHHQALHRCQPHRRVYRSATDDRRRRRTVAKVQHDLAQFGERHVHKCGRLLADVLVRRAMEPVAANVPLRGDIPVDRIRCRRRRQVMEERRVEDRDVWEVWERLARHANTQHRWRVVQRRKRRQLLELGDQRIVDQRRPIQVRAAVHHPVAHRDQLGGACVRADLVEHNAQRRLVVCDGGPFLTDSLDDAVDKRRARLRLYQLVFHRRRTRIEHQDAARHQMSCAWIAVIATVLTMSSTSAPRDRSFTGLFNPCNTGPIAIAPALRWTALYVLLPVLRSGKMRTVARPATLESGILALATVWSTAASYWM